MKVTPDTFRRIERRALVICILVMAVAFFIPGSGWRGMAGVAGGTFMIAISYFSLRRGLVGPSDAGLGLPPSKPSRIGGLFFVVGRYALLAVMAYVMIARLRLPLIGLLCGVTVVPVAVGLELSRRQV